MIRRQSSFVLTAILAWATVVAGQAPRARLASVVSPVIDAIWNGYDMRAAMGHVEFIGSKWRLPGNPSYNASIDRIRDRFVAAGLKPTIEEYPNNGLAWDHTVGTLALVNDGKADEPVITDHIALCINSFSTAPGGVVARLVDVGRGTEQDYAGKDIKGAVVLADQAQGQLWTRAVVNGGAIGIISVTPPARYLNPDAPGAPATPPDQWNIFQWTSVPYDATHKAFAFKGTPKTAGMLRKRLASAGASAVSVHVTIDATFSDGPVRTLSIEFPGRTAPDERIVLAAHVQEPGANDNASGVATLAETVVSLASAIKAKKVPQPERTLTFLFLTEISGSRQWLKDHAEAAKQVKYMFSLDMTGEDVKKTGGSFLVERYPDPGAVWDRPWDPHTEWGRGNVRAESLKGDLLNDAHWYVLEQVARKSSWVIHSNPYEGGSDHSEFQRAGVPSVLDWHFTDRYYHSNLDTPDKTSPEEMRNVGVGVATSAWLLASATPQIAGDVAAVVAAAGHARIDLETREGPKVALAPTDKQTIEERERVILRAWNKWYVEAVRSTSRLVVGTPPASLSADIERLAKTFDWASGPAPIASGGAPFPFAALLSLSAPTAQNVSAKPDRTTVFVCGNDQSAPDIVPTWADIVLAGDERFYTPCPGGSHGLDHRELRAESILAQGYASKDSELRWRAAQAYARNSTRLLPVATSTGTTSAAATAMIDGLGGMLDQGQRFSPACNAEAQIFDANSTPRHWQPGKLFAILRDAPAGLPAGGPTAPSRLGGAPAVRLEAAYGLGVRLSRPGLNAELLTSAVKELQACYLVVGRTGVDAATQGQILQDIGLARYEKDDQTRDAESFLIRSAGGSSGKAITLGAATGLEALYRQHRQFQASDDARAFLRRLATTGISAGQPAPLDVDARIRRMALMALQAARDQDPQTLNAAVMDGDWQVRRLVAGSINLLDPQMSATGETLAADPALQVRYELLSPVSRVVANTHVCAPIIERLKDPAPLVVMRAMDVLSPSCTDLADASAKLTEMARQLAKSESDASWQINSHALTALARLSPSAAKPLMPAAVAHRIWQVRAAAAAATPGLADEADALTLARDSEPNVQTAALDALSRMKSPAVVPAAIEALKTGKDYQLLRTAALVLKGLPAEKREEANTALIGALRRLTDEESDTSRDPRVAILDRLGETLDPLGVYDVGAFTTDFDDDVNAAARKAFAKLRNPPPPGSVKRRYPYQPLPGALMTLPSTAVIQLESGAVTLSLLKDVAPVTIARFAELAGRGYYNGLTFHRVVPNFVVQGGSPGANEYMGASRYMRDEVGPQGVHVRGAVGISTRGGDTGDGQIFIDLVDLPRLDRDYTVFAYVTSGMDFVDRILEGAKIVSVSVR